MRYVYWVTPSLLPYQTLGEKGGIVPLHTDLRRTLDRARRWLIEAIASSEGRELDYNRARLDNLRREARHVLEGRGAWRPVRDAFSEAWVSEGHGVGLIYRRELAEDA